MYVIAHRLQVAGAARLHEQGFVASTEHMAEEFAPVIEPAGADTREKSAICHLRFEIKRSVAPPPAS